MVSETMKLEVPAASGETPDIAKAAKRGDDKAMLKAAATMTRDLNRPDARIYWADLIASVVLGYGALALCIIDRGGVASYFAGVVAVLSLYRAGSFIHELAHIRKGDLPYFRLVWNALVGVPLLAPSFMYEGVHNQHHAKTKYGTIEDPEYLPLASMKPWSLPLFLIFAALAPVLVAVSRKSFLQKLTGRGVSDIGAATLAAELYAASNEADYIRTHDVRALRDALNIWKSLGS